MATKFSITAREEGYDPFVDVKLERVASNYSYAATAYSLIDSLVSRAVTDAQNVYTQFQVDDNDVKLAKFFGDMLQSLQAGDMRDTLRNEINRAIENNTNLRVHAWTAGQWTMHIDLTCDTSTEDSRELELNLFETDTFELPWT